MNRIILLILCLPLSFFVACGGDKPAEASSTEQTARQADAETSGKVETIKTELKEKAHEVAQLTEAQKKTLMENKDALVQKMQSALSEAGSMDNIKGAATNAFNKLKNSGDSTGTKAVMEKVNSAKEEVTRQIAALKEATPENWEALKAKAEAALAKFKQALADAKSD